MVFPLGKETNEQQKFLLQMCITYLL